jgi:hypothetical protein
MESICESCVQVFGSVGTLIILEGPFPKKKCAIKDRPEQSKYEVMHGPPRENPFRVSGTTPEKIASIFITGVLPDEDRSGWVIYQVDLRRRQHH